MPGADPVWPVPGCAVGIAFPGAVPTDGEPGWVAGGAAWSCVGAGVLPPNRALEPRECCQNRCPARAPTRRAASPRRPLRAVSTTSVSYELRPLALRTRMQLTRARYVPQAAGLEPNLRGTTAARRGLRKYVTVVVVLARGRQLQRLLVVPREQVGSTTRGLCSRPPSPPPGGRAPFIRFRGRLVA
jgi:hypothetical protein